MERTKASKQSFIRRGATLIDLAGGMGRGRNVSVAVFALILSLGPKGVEAAGDAPPIPEAYRVTIQNLTGGQPFSPPLVAVHNHRIDFFSVGAVASRGLQAIAENGNNALMSGRFMMQPDRMVSRVAEAAAPLVPGSNPGGTMFENHVTLDLATLKGTRFLSMATMLICTNDGFTGLDSVRLPRKGSRTMVTRAYDAGSEQNTEDFIDMVPPCQGLIGVSSQDPGTGESNPALSENGSIGPHPGIGGGADLLPDVHGWQNPVARVTITRVSPTGQRFGAPLSGRSEVVEADDGQVGMVDSAATGLAIFRLQNGETELAYRLTVSRLEGVTQAHIHIGMPHENAPVVVFLFGPVAPSTGQGSIAEGVLTADDLVGTVAGDFAALVLAMREGRAYVNVHTEAHPRGEIRGQVGVVW